MSGKSIKPWMIAFGMNGTTCLGGGGDNPLQNP